MKRRLMALGALLVGCGRAAAPVAAEEPVAQPVATVPEAVPEPQATASAEPVAEVPAVTETASIEPLGTVGCRVETGGKDVFQRVQVRVKSGGARWGFFEHTSSVNVELPPSGDSDGRAVASLGGMELYGVVDGDDFKLLRRTVRKDGVVVPFANTELSWVRSAGDGELVVGAEAVDAVQPAEGKLFEWTDPCAALSLAQGRYEPKKALGLTQTNPIYLLATDAITMSADAAGAGAVKLRVDADVEAFVLARRGKRSKIWVGARNVLLVGWVDSSALSKNGNGGLGLGGMGYGGGYGRTSAKRMRCPSERSVTLRMNEHEWQVGRITAGARFRVVAREDGGMASVEPDETGLFLLKGATLWASVEGCRTA